VTPAANGISYPDQVSLGVEEASPEHRANGAGALTETSTREAPVLEHGTQAAPWCVESGGR
jgi:hypothetical protein